MRARHIAACAVLCAATLSTFACAPSGRPANGVAETENPASITDFKTLFQSNCSGCHGDDGQKGPARILNNALYLSVLPRQELENVIRYGRPGTQMPAWAKSQGGPLTNHQVDILVNGIYSNWGKGMPAPKDAPAYADNGAGDPGHGKQLFLMNCFMCHAKGMNPGPINTPNFLQLASNQMIRTSIIVGRPDLGMPSYQFLNRGKPLSNQDVTDLVAYLNSLRTSPAPGQPTNGGVNQHTNENGTGQQGQTVKGNEGSGNGPGSPGQRKQEGNKGAGSNSQRGIK